MTPNRLDIFSSTPFEGVSREIGPKRDGVEMLPIGAPEVKTAVDSQYQKVLKTGLDLFTTTRGIEQLLKDGKEDYARLPDLPGKPAIQIFQELSPGSSFLDVGPGSGDFIVGVLRDINSKLDVYGFDARTWRKRQQKKIPHLVLGNIDNLPDVDFGGVSKFDVVTCAAVLYHLEDYWGAILRMADRVKTGGVLLASTLPRVQELSTRGGELVWLGPADNDDGTLREADYGQVAYYANMSTFFPDGKIAPMSEIITALNLANPDHQVFYSAAKGTKFGTTHYGGQIAVVNNSQKGFELANLFYCRYRLGDDPSLTKICYLLARDNEEKEILQGKGYTSVQERFDQRLKNLDQ